MGIVVGIEDYMNYLATHLFVRPLALNFVINFPFWIQICQWIIDSGQYKDNTEVDQIYR